MQSPSIGDSRRTSNLQQEVELFLNQCGLSQYFEIFIQEGFDRLESVKKKKKIDIYP